MIDIERLFADFSVPISLTVNAGWLNTNCPYCADTKNHLGFKIGEDYCNCWKCGSHNLEHTLKRILKLNSSEMINVLQQYRTEDILRSMLNKKTPKSKKLEFPEDKLNSRERKYLRGRGFNPDFLEQKYLLRSGGIVGDFSYRIIIPLILNGQLVSWTGRDITDNSELRYRTLEIEKSVVDPKTVLFNLDNAKNSMVVVVEGPFDVLRMGDDFVCSFGTSMTEAQINLLAKRYKQIIFLFDPEEAAQKKAKRYAQQLASLGRSVDVVDSEMGKDPGDFSGAEVSHLRRELRL